MTLLLVPAMPLLALVTLLLVPPTLLTLVLRQPTLLPQLRSSSLATALPRAGSSS